MYSVNIRDLTLVRRKLESEVRDEGEISRPGISLNPTELKTLEMLQLHQPYVGSSFSNYKCSFRSESSNFGFVNFKILY